MLAQILAFAAFLLIQHIHVLKMSIFKQLIECFSSA
jgi:hypothetical protein